MPIKRICRVRWRNWRPYCGFRAADLPLDGSPRRITRHAPQGRPAAKVDAIGVSRRWCSMEACGSRDKMAWSSAYRRGRGPCRRTNPAKSGSVTTRRPPGTAERLPRDVLHVVVTHQEQGQHDRAGQAQAFRPAGPRLPVATHKSGHRHGPFGARPLPAGDPAGVEPRPVGAAAPGGRSAPPVGRPASGSYPAVALSPHDPGEPSRMTAVTRHHPRPFAPELC